MADNNLTQGVAKDYVELLNQAIDMQINNKLSKANFDKTDEGTVISVVDQDNGVYLVQIQNSRFEAYSIGPRYYENDKVYIKIPSNDYTKQKFITGRIVSEDGTASESLFNFRYPFDDFVPLMNLSENELQTSFLTIGEDQQKGYRANDPGHGVGTASKYVNPEDDPNLVWHWKRNGGDFIVGTTTLGLQMDVTNFLLNYAPVSGDYGLKIIVTGDLRSTDDKVDQDVQKEYFFTTKNMYGNPYNYIDITTQQILIDLTEFLIVNEICAYFWQDYNFLDSEWKRIKYLDDNGDVISPNIFLSNFKAMYGLTTNDIAAEKLFLYTYDDLKFGYDANSTTPRAKLDTRTLRFAWVHQLGEREFITINNEEALKKFNSSYEEGSSDRASIHWYRQRRATDQQGDGVLYLAPGTTTKEVREKIAKLEEDKAKELASLDKSKYSDEDTYYAVYKRKESYYDRKIDYLESILEDSDGATKLRLTSLAGTDYQLLPDYDDQFNLKMLLDINTFHERFKVVVCYDGSYEVSDPIEFENVDSNKADDFNNANKELIFRLLRTETYKDSLGKKQTRIVEDNSIGSFYVYDENNQCIVNENNEFYSDIYYYIQIWIYNYAAEAYIPLTSEATEDTVEVSWRCPTSNTMITTFAPVDTTDAVYNSTLIPTGESAFNGIYATTRKFKISDFWDVRAQDNMITAVVIRNGKQFVLQKQLRFGQSGSTGSKYTIRMDLSQPGGYMMVSGSAFQIDTTVYDQTGKKVESSLFTFRYELLNDGPCRIGAQFFSSTSKGSTWSTLSTGGYTGNSIYGYLLSEEPPLFKVYVDLQDPLYSYEIEGLRGFLSTTDFNVCEQYMIGVSDRVEYKSDGTLPVYDSSFFEVTHILSDSLVYPQWFMTQYKKDSITGQFKELEIPEHIKLEHVDSSNRKLNSNTENTTIKNNQENESGLGYRRYRLNPYRDATGEIDDAIAFFWDDDMESTYATFVGCYLDGARVYQAIAFAQNVYASSLVNSWDGQLLIDKENNAILTKMLAAGSKDSRNRFSGVMMGDWAAKGDTSIDPIGLYGFNHGKQTYGFKSDGTGFIGAAGYGQIKFDGRQALISDYYKDHYINLNPQYFSVNTETKALEVISGSYSQYFIYAKNKKLDVQTALTSNQSGTIYCSDKWGWINTAWADIFRNDTEHDYFVVDPNNGVYMSGGIIARYGMIGECLQLSSAGLTYQKNNGIIFIGQERARDGSLYYLENNEKKYIDGASIDDVPFDNNFWWSGGVNAYNPSNTNGSSFDFDANSSKVGRYIFWAGTAGDERGKPAYKYPNFGIEHDGSVHLNNAYVQGKIRATSLEIIAPDGQYHNFDENDRMAATYYSTNNPANVKTAQTEPGICNKSYGDLLYKGDLWYDISVRSKTSGSTMIDQNTHKVNLNNYGISNSGQLDGFDANGYSSSYTSPASASNSYGYNSSSSKIDAKQGYKIYKWSGNPNAPFKKNDGSTDSNDSRKGWEEQKTLSYDLWTELTTMSETAGTALTQIATEMAKDVKKAYDGIRTGMSPISFYKSGNCYVSISCRGETIDSKYGIGNAPPGISVYQLNNNGVYSGSSFLLNGERMGFYQQYQSGNTVVDLPLLAYHKGNLALAGSLLLGLDINNATGAVSTADANLYKNILDGPNAKISLGDGAIVLDSDVAHQGTANHNPKITLGALEGKATIKIAGYEMIGNTLTPANAFSFSLKDMQEKNVPWSGTYKLWTMQYGNNTGNETTKTISISYKNYYVGKATNYKIGQLNYFKLVHGGRGIQVLENQAAWSYKKLTYYLQGEGENATIQSKEENKSETYHFTLLKPEKSGNDAKNIILDWDIIQANNGSFNEVETTTLFTKNIYVYNSANKAVELADKEWVTNRLYDVYKTLAEAISDSQKTGDQAYGAARNHTHDASGRVKTTQDLGEGDDGSWFN